MNVTVFGSGYVGLVTAACLARMGNYVLCVDIDADRVRRLEQGEVPIREEGLDPIVADALDNGHLRFTTDGAAGVAHGELQFIAVGTPSAEDGSADLSAVMAVARTIGEHMDDYRLVINKSTVPVGTAERVRQEISTRLAERGVTVEFDVASNPEFLKEGVAVEDFMKPDRIIVGCDSERARTLMTELYAPFNRLNDRLIVMDARSAELAKYAANAMLATKISLMNEFANIAERVGADIDHVRQGIGSDPRIGYHFIYPGTGYGGSCFPKDVSALEHISRESGHEPKILRAVQDVNQRQKHRLVERIREHFDGKLAGRTFALWGLAFKPGTDDMREAPSRVIMEALWEAGARVQAHDPAAMPRTQELYGEREDLKLYEHPLSALDGADALVIVTEWHVFRSPDFSEIRSRLAEPVIFDGRNIFEPARVTAEGLSYYSIGRNPVLKT